MHFQRAGDGLSSLKYLTPHFYRIAISKNRIIKIANQQATFRYKATDVPLIAKSSKNGKSFPLMNASPLGLLSPGHICCELEERKPAWLCAIVCAV
jgi:hypothetical protein